MAREGGPNPRLSGVPVKKSENLATGNCSPFLAWLGAPLERYTRGPEATTFISMGTCLSWTGTVRRRAPPDGPEM